MNERIKSMLAHIDYLADHIKGEPLAPDRDILRQAKLECMCEVAAIMIANCHNDVPPTDTPWGKADSKTKLAAGIWAVTTPSHGGIWLAKWRWDDMPTGWKTTPHSNNGWYEEDCDWCLPFVYYEEDIVNGCDANAQHVIGKDCHINAMIMYHRDLYDEMCADQAAEDARIER